MTFDIYQTVTDRIVQTIEAGTAREWTCPWHRRGGGLPTNALTGRHYRGVNVLSLWCAEQAGAYGDSRWATYRQWSELGAQVRKGEKSTLILFFKDYENTADDGEKERRCVARASWAFNAAQVDGAPARADPLPQGYVTHGIVDDLAMLRGARIIEAGEQACYVPSIDEIRMPSRSLFKDMHGRSSILAHEMVHWSGAKGRLDRDLSGRFKSRAYAAEELVAELGSAFLMGRFGVSSEPHPQHAAYMAHWLPLLREDPRAIFTAAAAAARAADYLATGETGAP